MLDLDSLEQLAAAATPGPWRNCGADRGGCSCGFIWSVPTDALILTATIGDYGDDHAELRVGEDGQPEAFMSKSIYGSVPTEAGKANAAFVAALSPEVVKELISLARTALT